VFPAAFWGKAAASDTTPKQNSVGTWHLRGRGLRGHAADGMSELMRNQAGRWGISIDSRIGYRPGGVYPPGLTAWRKPDYLMAFTPLVR